jgi:hypothetical protein
MASTEATQKIQRSSQRALLGTITRATMRTCAISMIVNKIVFIIAYSFPPDQTSTDGLTGFRHVASCLHL